MRSPELDSLQWESSLWQYKSFVAMRQYTSSRLARPWSIRRNEPASGRVTAWASRLDTQYLPRFQRYRTQQAQGKSGESALYKSTVVQVNRFSGGSFLSPIRRFGQRFVTRISSVLRPGLTNPARFISNGCFQRIPAFRPLMVTSARFFTAPRSRNARLEVSCSAVNSNSRLYVAVPEKCLTPSSA